MVEGIGPLQGLLGQLQFGSRVGLVGVLAALAVEAALFQVSSQAVAAAAEQPGDCRRVGWTVGDGQGAVQAADLAGGEQQQRV